MFTHIRTRRPVLLAAPFVALGLMAPTANADTIHVPDDYPTIQEALFAAHDGDVIIVADGVWTGPYNKNIDFGGLALTLRSENGPENCVIDCEGDGRGFEFRFGEGPDSVVQGFAIINGDPAFNDGGGIFCRNGSSPSVVNCILSDNSRAAIYCIDSSPTINGCTLTGSTSGAGGGLYCSGGNLRITNSTILGNTAFDTDGGGVYGDHASLTITACTITGNTANDDGGGVYCSNGSLTITASTITGNTAHDGGGGVYCWNCSDVPITGCTISGNSASVGNGGGVYCRGGSLSIANCTITENTVQGQHERGGGVYCSYGNLTITDSTINGNVADGAGAGVCCDESDAIMANCTISGNRTTSSGGGLYCVQRDLVIANSTISGNTAYNGAGIYCSLGSPTISGSTITGNAAYGYYGGGVYCNDSGNASVVNTVLWNDAAANGPEIALLGDSYMTVDYSDVEGGWAWVYISLDSSMDWGGGNIIADPLFVDPDGPDDDPNTWEDNDCHLGTGSPCIDTGDPDFVPGADERDIDGQMRVWDGDDDGVWRVDMGSDEYGSQAPGDLNGDGCVDHADLGIFLSDWGCSGGDCPGDCDFDGDTDHSDLGILLAHWGEGCP